MKKLILPLMCLLFLAFVSSTGARMSLTIVAGQPPAGGCVEELKQTIDASGSLEFNIGKDDSNDWIYLTGKFTADATYTVTKVTLYVAKVSSPTGSIYSNIYTDSSGTPNTLISNGQSSAMDGSTVAGSAADFDFTYAEGSRPDLTNTTVYHVGMQAPLVDVSNYWKITYNDAGANGVDKSANGSDWTAQDNSAEIRAKIYGCQ